MHGHDSKPNNRYYVDCTNQNYSQLCRDLKEIMHQWIRVNVTKKIKGNNKFDRRKDIRVLKEI